MVLNMDNRRTERIWNINLDLLLHCTAVRFIERCRLYIWLHSTHTHTHSLPLLFSTLCLYISCRLDGGVSCFTVFNQHVFSFESHSAKTSLKSVIARRNKSHPLNPQKWHGWCENLHHLLPCFSVGGQNEAAFTFDSTCTNWFISWQIASPSSQPRVECVLHEDQEKGQICKTGLCFFCWCLSRLEQNLMTKQFVKAMQLIVFQLGPGVFAKYL